jgi:aryl-alcohol dehydrogenase-like predicted oxidoreductase
MQIVNVVEEIAGEKGCTSAQVALAWVLQQGDDVVPIPGTKRRKYLEDNAGSLNVKLTEEETRRLEDFRPAGDRYTAPGMAMIGR